MTTSQTDRAEDRSDPGGRILEWATARWGARRAEVVLGRANSAAVNLVLLAGLPFLGYYAYQRWRWKRSLGEVARRAGLQPLGRRDLAASAAFAAAGVSLLWIWGPPLEALVRNHSPQRRFVGLDLRTALAGALLHGVVETGFCEELLFRGLIAGSLSRRHPLAQANLEQALIFVVPHLPLVRVPGMRGFPVIVFAGSLFLGRLRIESKSFLGTWLIHGSLNVATSLSVAIRTRGPADFSAPGRVPEPAHSNGAF